MVPINSYPLANYILKKPKNFSNRSFNQETPRTLEPSAIKIFLPRTSHYFSLYTLYAPSSLYVHTLLFQSPNQLLNVINYFPKQETFSAKISKYIISPPDSCTLQRFFTPLFFSIIFDHLLIFILFLIDLMFPVKEEYPGASSSSGSWAESSDQAAPPPRPMEGLNDMGPPPFLTKTFDMVDGLSTDHTVSWSRGGHSFVVWDPHAFSTSVLPRYFKHNNFSSFVRQLNTYGFRKIDPDKWEFANEAFLKGQKHLLRNIRRRKATAHQQPLPSHQPIAPCVEVGRFGLDGEINSLRRDKQVLLTELVKLRQQQQSMRAFLQQLEVRLQGTERKQQQMMSFLARAMQNPEFIHQLVQQKKRKELEEAMSKKRRRPIEAGESSHRGNVVKVEPMEFGDANGFQVSELEALALEIQGFGRAKREDMEEFGRLLNYDKELDDGFWEELLNEGFDEVGLPSGGAEDGEEEDVNVLADRLGFLGSSPN